MKEKKMDSEKKIRLMEQFISKLMDDESRKLYDMRFEFFFDKDENMLEQKIGKMVEKYRESFYCWGLSQYYNRHPEKKNSPFVVFGAGNMGKRTLRTLKYLNLPISGLVDNSESLWGTEAEGVIVENPNCILEKYSNCVVVVAVAKQTQIDILYQLLNMGIEESNICMHHEGGLYLDLGTQYFDLENLTPDPSGEIFVDVGCFNGMSSVNAASWANGCLKKVYAFEPDANSIALCEKNIEKIGCEFELYNLATWNEKAKLCFAANKNAGYGSRVSEEGDLVVEADSIDNILHGRPVTYIKLDVEGSELNTLKGAINTIKKYRPKMAISIYHKLEDIFEIPIFLETLDMGYKYYIRHYQTRKEETILYVL